MDSGQILDVHAAEAIFHQELSGYAGPVHQRSGKCAVIPLFYAAAGASGLKHDKIRLLANGGFKAFCRSCTEFRIHVPAVFGGDDSVPDFRGNPRRRQAAHLLRANGDNFIVRYQLQDLLIPVVATVIFTILTC